MAADVQSIIDYYTNLLIIQYHDQPNAKAVIELVVSVLLAEGIIFDVRDGYNIDTAVGHQLDILGKYIGADRFFQGQELDGYFAFTEYTEITIPAGKLGFQQYSQFPEAGLTLDYADVIGVGLALTDDDYRTLLKLKIVQNNINHSWAEIDAAIFATFGSTVWADSSGNMIMYYFVPPNLTEIIRAAIQKAILPVPLAVRLNYYITADDTNPYFAFATYAGPPQVLGEGFQTYATFGNVAGQTLEYAKLLTGE